MTDGLVCEPMSSPLDTISDVIPDDDCPTAEAPNGGGGDPPAGSDEGDTTTLPRSS